MFFKTAEFFLHALSRWIHNEELCPLQPPMPLPAACKAQSVNDKPRKKIQFALFCLFFGKDLKEMPLLNQIVPIILRKIDIKKNNNNQPNFRLLYLKKKDKFIAKTEILLKFIQFYSKQHQFLDTLLTWVHHRGLHYLQPQASLPAACRAQMIKKQFYVNRKGFADIKNQFEQQSNKEN